MTESGHTFTVLVVDDVLQNIQVVASTLRPQGYNVVFATSGEDALSRVKATVPDLILLDIMMPGMSGFELCQSLKASPVTEHIPIIFITANTESQTLVRSFELGGVDYITKPFNPAELTARVATHCKLHYYQKSAEEKHNELVAVHHTLEDVVEKRTNQLRYSLEKEKQFGQMNTALIASIGHEFRTPMTVIQNSLELLRYLELKPGDSAIAKRNRVREQMLQGVNEMSKHLDSITRMLRTRTTMMTETAVSCSLATLIADTVRQFNSRYGASQHLDVVMNASDVQGYIMHENFSVAIDELLKNAAVYSTHDTGITLLVSIENSDLVLSVCDRGRGIPEESSEIIYEWFRRGESETEVGEKRGLGIGLSLVRMCANNMQGSISHHAREGGGTCFVLRIANFIIDQWSDAETNVDTVNHPASFDPDKYPAQRSAERHRGIMPGRHTPVRVRFR